MAGSNIKLLINFKKSSIQVVKPKKRSAAHLDIRAVLEQDSSISAARLAGYTDEELEVAVTLSGMSFYSLYQATIS